MTLAEIKREYDRVKSQDQDLNGIPDLLEDAVLPASRPFTGLPFLITGGLYTFEDTNAPAYPQRFYRTLQE